MGGSVKSLPTLRNKVLTAIDCPKRRTLALRSPLFAVQPVNQSPHAAGNPLHKVRPAPAVIG